MTLPPREKFSLLGSLSDGSNTPQIIPILGGLVLYMFIGALVKSPGRSLQHKFIACNPLKGKPMNEIIARCGQPTSRSSQANGNQLFQWQSTGYHIALLMD